MTRTPIALIVAESFMQATLTATIDWHWSRAGGLEFETPTGERIRYAHDDHNSIRGHARGTKIYFGFGWRSRRDADEIRILVGAGIFVASNPAIDDAHPPGK